MNIKYYFIRNNKRFESNLFLNPQHAFSDNTIKNNTIQYEFVIDRMNRWEI